MFSIIVHMRRGECEIVEALKRDGFSITAERCVQRSGGDRLRGPASLFGVIMEFR